MKIVFISTFFTGATLPFIKHLNDDGHNVDLYLFAKQGQKGMETLVFDTAVNGVNIRKLHNNNPIYGYLSKSINVSIVPYYIREGKKTWRDLTSYFRNMRIVYNLTKMIEKESYDIIYIIVHEKLDYLLCKRLKAKGHKNIIIAYHEVINSHMKVPSLKKVVKKTVRYGYPIITHSDNTRNTLEKLTNDIKIHKIYFGPFETYKLYESDTSMINEKYILFIGSISPYKGLPFLYETMKQYRNTNFRIVIAGAGYDHVLEQMKKDERYIIINRFLKDSEFVNLVKYALCVICPYAAGSQSGIPQVAMVFKTPVIATRVGAFPEVIEDCSNGYLVDYRNTEQLATAIRRIAEQKSKRDFNIPEHLNWSSIVRDFLLTFINDNTPH